MNTTITTINTNTDTKNPTDPDQHTTSYIRVTNRRSKQKTQRLTSNKTLSTSISMMCSSSDMSNPGVEGRVTTGLSAGVGMADIYGRWR
jgi:hypothetical protein